MTPTNTNELAGSVAVVTGVAAVLAAQSHCSLRALEPTSLCMPLTIKSAEQTAAEITRSGRQSQFLLADFQNEKTLSDSHPLPGTGAAMSIFGSTTRCRHSHGQQLEARFPRRASPPWQIDVQATMPFPKQSARNEDSVAAARIINIGWDQVDSGMAGEKPGELFARPKAPSWRSLAVSLNHLRPSPRQLHRSG